MQTELWCHPAHPSAAVEAIAVTVERLGPQALHIDYSVAGRIGELALPIPAPPIRADNLWRTTCFEAFLAPVDASHYRELNFSPSSQWAAYEFCAYRAGLVPMALPAAPRIAMARRPDRLDLSVALTLDLGAGPGRIGLCAVVEERGGRFSYWALAHPPGEPDFHHPACFAFELPPAPPA
jgi:hypothetical protein